MNRLATSAFGCSAAATLIVLSAAAAHSSGSQSAALVRLQSSIGTPQTGNINISGQVTASALSVSSGGSLSITSANPGSCVIEGINTDPANNSYGVCGQNTATSGNQAGVFGQSNAANLNGIGVYGIAAGHIGVFGTGFEGVHGTSPANNGNGLVGIASVGSDAWGVSGQSASGTAGVFQAGTPVGGGFPTLTGVVARSTGASGYGLYAVNTTNLVTGRAGYFNGKVQIVDGTQTAGTSILTGDSTGTASWQNIATLANGNTFSNWVRTAGSPDTLVPKNVAATNVGIGTASPASRLHVENLALNPTGAETLRVLYGNGAAQITGEGIEVVSTAVTNKGAQHGVLATASVSSAGNNAGSAQGILANSASFVATGGHHGVNGTATATEIDNFSASNISSVNGGNFAANVNNINIHTPNQGTYWLSGVHTQISGAVNTTPTTGAIAAISANDLVTGSATHWAGFFQGKSTFNNSGAGGAIFVNDSTKALNRVLTCVNAATGEAQWVAPATSTFTLPFTGSANTKAAGNFCNGVFEVDTSAGNTFTAICGRTNGAASSGASSDAGVHGISTGGGTVGVLGEANGASTSKGLAGFSTQGYGAYGEGATYGVFGTTATTYGWGGCFTTTGASGTGGALCVNGRSVMTGNLNVTGTVSKGGGSFKIDHPLDPQNKFLYHSFVESPDMMNIYNGEVRTDKKGYALITMPDWFEALNRDFRYQLTVVDDGSDSDDWVLVRVAKPMHGNQFMIRSNQPRVLVSWQVTGIRHDAFADAHRIPVEEEKQGEEKGLYLHPVENGQPIEMGIDYNRMHRRVSTKKHP